MNIMRKRQATTPQASTGSATPHAFQRRLMNRVRLVLALTLFVVVMFTVADVQLQQRNELRADSERALSFLQTEVDRELTEPVDDLLALARSAVVQSFSQTLSDLTVNVLTGEQRDQLTRVAQSFENTLSAHRGRYLALRYLTLEAQQWVAVTNLDGELAVEMGERASPYNMYVGFAQAPEFAAPGEVYIGQTFPGEERSETSVLIYAPVSGTENRNATHGLLQMQISLEPAAVVLNSHIANEAQSAPGRRVLLVDESGTILLDVGPQRLEAEDLHGFLQDRSGDFFHVSHSDLFVSAGTVKRSAGINTPWRVVIVDDYSAPLAQINLLSALIAGVFVLTWFVLVFLLNVVLRPLLRPLADVSGVAATMAAQGREQDIDFDPATLVADQIGDEQPVLQTRNDEIGQLFEALGTMTGRVERLHRQVENEAGTRQRDLELASRLGRTLAAVSDMDTLLERSVLLICNTLGHYHAEVYIVDDIGMNALMTYSRRMENSRERVISIDSPTPAAQAINEQHPIVIDRVTPELRDRLDASVQSLVALPLIAGERIVGSLVLFSNVPGSFPDDDLPLLQLLADQMAVGVYNARIARQTAERVERINTLNRQLTRAGWETTDSLSQSERAYRYNLHEVTPDATQPDELTPGALSSPITIRGEPVGALTIEPEDENLLTDGDRMVLEAVANRVALAIENARLFQETQVSLAETSTLYQLSRYLNEANSLEEIIEAVIVSVMPDANGGQVWVFDEYSSYDAPSWIELQADYATAGEAARELVGLRLNIGHHEFLRNLQENRVTLVKDVRQDSRFDPQLLDILDDLDTVSLAVIPLIVRSVWRGAVTITYDHARDFSERESGIYSALIDQAGVAIDNRLLLRSTEEALSRNENLYAASRIINQAQDAKELVYAVVATSNDPSLQFSLAMFEGDLDRTGWPSKFRLVAQSAGGIVHPRNEVYPIGVAAESPMRRREPELWLLEENEDLDEIEPDGLKRWMQQQHYRFMAVFPLFSANQPIALFTITSHRHYELSADDYEVYRALTGQMSTQLQIRRLLERTEQALDETRRLYIASRAITSAGDAQDIYRVAREHLIRPFIQADVEAGKQATHDITFKVLMTASSSQRNTPQLEVVYAWNTELNDLNDQTGQYLDAVQHPYKFIVQQAEDIAYFGDIAANQSQNALLNDYPHFRQSLIDRRIASFIAVPVQSRLRWFGVLVLESNRTGAFDEQYQRFLLAVADQVSIAVENKQLFLEAQQEAERAQNEAQRALALVEASQFANRLGEFLELSLGEVFERVAQAAGFNRWVLALLDPAYDRLNLFIARTPGMDTGDDLYFDMNMPLPLVEAARLNESVIINETALVEPVLGDVEIFGTLFGRHIAAPVSVGDTVLGALVLGRNLDDDLLDGRDEELVNTLAGQVAVALENRRLFAQTEREQARLQSILATMPAGILVLDPHTLQPLLHNDRIEEYLGYSIDSQIPFDATTYHLIRTGTNMHYPKEEMPVFVALQEDRPAFSDDIAVVLPDGQLDLMINAAPIHDTTGRTTAIVAAFQDISNLRSLEATLQENLRETVALYEAQRQLGDADELDDVLDVILEQLFMLQPNEGYVISAHDFGKDDDMLPHVERYMMSPPDDILPLLGVLDDYDMVIMHDVQSDIKDDQVRQYITEAGFNSLIAVPMRTRQALLGWLLVMNTPEQQFTEEQERVISQLSDVATTAIENRLLIRDQQQTVHEIGLLYNTTAAISRIDDIDELAIVMQAAASAMQPDAAFAYLNPGVRQDTEGQHTLFMLDKADAFDLDALQALMLEQTIPESGLFVEDIAARGDPDAMLREFAAAGVRAVAATNLRVKDQPGGRVVLLFKEPRKFGEDANRYLNTVNDSSSVVIDNILLLEQVQGTLEQTSILYQASRALTNATTEHDILDVVVDYLIQPDTTQAFIGLLEVRNWDIDGATIQVTASWSTDIALSLDGLSLGRDQFPAWELLKSQDVVAINDVETDDRLDEMGRVGVAGLGLRSIVVMPLRVANRSIGVIWLGSEQPQRYSDRQLRTYQSFAEQASLSIEASYLLQQTERRARQLQTSAEVSESASQILDLEVLLPRVVNLIKDSFEYDHVQIFLMDERDEWAVLRASTGEAGRTLLSINHKLAKGSGSVIGQVTERAVPQIALDTADADVIHKPNPHLPMTRSEMALPLIIKGQVVGALDVQSNQPGAFNEEDVAALTTLAAQISVAIDNANNYAETEKQAERMSFLFDTTTATASAAADSLDEALDTVTQEVYRAFDSTAAMIYLPQRYLDHEDNIYTTLKIASLVGSDQPLSGIEEIDTTDADKLLAVVYATGEAVIVDRISEEPRYLPVVESARSAVIAPLQTGVKNVGMIVIESAHEYTYDEDSVRLLRALAGSLSAIIQSAQLLEQLTSTNEQLRELDKVKSDFLANMSHELRTPLNSIIGFSRVMLKGIDGPLTEMQEQDLTTIFTSGQHLLKLINDVLDQAKIASGKMEVKPEYFDVKPLVEAVKSIGIGLVKDKPISLNVEYAPSLPQAYGDEFRIRQVLINLVSNASKFTQEGGIILRVYTEPHPRTGATMVRIDVVDTGIGIAEKDLSLLFEAFRQVDSSLTRTVGGTGLGLPIAKSLVEIQGGQMTVTSEVNVGSTFSITLPVEPPPEEEATEGDEDTMDAVSEGDVIDGDTLPDNGTQQEDRPPSQSTVPVPTMAKATATQPMAAMPPKRDIVLIEDNRDMVDQFRRTLQREGFEVQTADHPAYAEAMVGNLRPTMVVMDVNFAGGEGWSILERLKSRDDTVDIPVIVVTLSDEKERALELGAFEFLQRPFLPDDLVKIVLAAEEDNNTQRVLVISDDADEVSVLEDLLHLEDTYRVYTGTGAEGMSLVARRRPDLIVLNPELKEMDGFALLAELRSHPETASIPLIVVGEENLQPQNGLLDGISVVPRDKLSNGSSRAFLREVRALLGG